MKCLSGQLCEFGPTEATCHSLDFNGTKFSYHCEAVLPSNIEFDQLNIKCEMKNRLVLKGNLK